MTTQEHIELAIEQVQYELEDSDEGSALEKALRAVITHLESAALVYLDSQTILR